MIDLATAATTAVAHSVILSVYVGIAVVMVMRMMVMMMRISRRSSRRRVSAAGVEVAVEGLSIIQLVVPVVAELRVDVAVAGCCRSGTCRGMASSDGTRHLGLGSRLRALLVKVTL